MNSEKFREIITEGFSGTGSSESTILDICLNFSENPEELRQVFEDGAEFNITSEQKNMLEEYLEELNHEIAWIESTDEEKLLTLNSEADNLKIFIQNFREEVQAILEEDYELEEIAEALEDRQLAEEAEKSREELRRIKSQIQEIAAREEKALKYIEHIEKIEEKLGSLDQIEAALVDRKEKVEILLENANHETTDRDAALVRDVIRLYSEGNLNDFENYVKSDITHSPPNEDGLEYSILCPTLLSSSGGSYSRSNRRQLSLAAYILVLHDVRAGNERCYEILNPENDVSPVDLGNNDLRAQIAEIYEKFISLDESRDFELITGNYKAYYVRPTEYDLDEGEIVINILHPDNINENLLTERVLNTLEPKIGAYNVPAAIEHELVHYLIPREVAENDSIGDVDWDTREPAAIDEGSAFAVSRIWGNNADVDTDEYKRLFGTNEGDIEAVKNAMYNYAETEAGGSNSNKRNAIISKAMDIIEERQSGNPNALSDFVDSYT